MHLVLTFFEVPTTALESDSFYLGLRNRSATVLCVEVGIICIYIVDVVMRAFITGYWGHWEYLVVLLVTMADVSFCLSRYHFCNPVDLCQGEWLATASRFSRPLR